MGKIRNSGRDKKEQKKTMEKHPEEKAVNNQGETANEGDDNMNVEADNDTPDNEREENSGISTEDNDSQAVLEEKIKEKEDQYLRLVAEFDNYRKRTLKEKADLTRLGGEDIISGLLPVMDDFDRAIEAMQNTKDTKAIKKGIELIYNKLGDFLKQKGIKEIKAMGTKFDTDFHEAVTKIPAGTEKEKGKIVDVIEKGYLLHDKVIRYAKVVVGE